ncbi:hypothetical protein MSLAZ_2573 [Methanosarcina lacustris Z-7289]|uniref:Uncharacterized protein n=1 Tax=Methanosarcina lacustris Z-7289 TaxID=1434111 RepID=A0A0E3S480_9EURY|nr:hypothetical protein [Methanosarcina lacustris]AKB75834.1 hypothetical protein MSLAZ_2573 [Methanosarcina lacustris Z-7289]
MNQDLLEILVDIFKSSGYNVIISSQSDIRVEKNGHQAYVMCALKPDYEEIKSFSEKIDACTGIYVMTQKISGKLNDYAAELGIYIWDRDELALQIGRAVLANMERKSSACQNESEIPLKESQNHVETAPELAGENWGENFKQELYSDGKLVPLQDTSRETEKISFEPRTLLKSVEERKTLKRLENDEVSRIEPYDMLNIQSVEPKISKDQAIIIAKPYLSSPKDVILKFVPFWKYSYSVEAEKRFRSKVMSITGEGGGYLNALNKSKENIDIEGFGTPTRIPAVQYEVKRPNVDKKQAEKILLSIIIQENTREMRFNNLEGQAIIYEQKSISPKANEIELYMDLVYIPVWEVKGKRNSLEINAYNASVLEEPIDEDAEFL